MGPVNKDWIEKNGNHWRGGRIDVHDEHADYFDHSTREFGVPLMHAEDWSMFSEWLWDFESDEVLNLDQLVGLYECEHPKIRWFLDQTR